MLEQSVDEVPSAVDKIRSPFYFAFHHSSPYSSPVIRDA